jgi:hypothetical protein
MQQLLLVDSKKPGEKKPGSKKFSQLVLLLLFFLIPNGRTSLCFPFTESAGERKICFRERITTVQVQRPRETVYEVLFFVRVMRLLMKFNLRRNDEKSRGLEGEMEKLRQ